MEKAVLITGASRGIGAQVARGFAANGMRVALAYHKNHTKAQQLCEELNQQGATAMSFAVDVTQDTSVQQMYQEVCKQIGAPDILINNAGIAQQKLFTDLSVQDWDRMMNVHAKGAFLCCREALPYMIRQKWGRIINISSMWGQTGASCEVHYSAAKAAIIGFTKALAKEEAPSGITVNCVAPGVIDTDMLNSFTNQEKQALAADTPVERLGTPQDIASAVLFLASEESSFITGQVLGVNGGFVI